MQVADGALSQVTTLLDRAVTLATESATGTVSDSQRVALDTEYQSIKAEIDNIGSTTNFNGGQVFTNNTLNVFLSDGSTSGSSTIGVSTGLLSSTQLSLGGTPATATLGEAVASSAAAADDVLTGGTFVGSTQANSLLTASTQFNALTKAAATFTRGHHQPRHRGHPGADRSHDVGGFCRCHQLVSETGVITAGDTCHGRRHDLYLRDRCWQDAGAVNQIVAANLVTQRHSRLLQAAINGTGVNGNTGDDFAANTAATATSGSDSTITLTSTSNTAAAPAISSTGTSTWASTGTTAATLGTQVTVGSQTYTFVTNLGTGAGVAANEVKYSATIDTALTNLQDALINGPAGTGSGTLYSTGTAKNTTANAGTTVPTTGTLTLTATRQWQRSRHRWSNRPKYSRRNRRFVRDPDERHCRKHGNCRQRNLYLRD